MKPTIILHIGRHKSGTTSLQQFLCDNEKLLLEKGFYYPKKTRSPIAHHLLAYSLHQKKKDSLSQNDIKTVNEFWQEIKDYDNIIISSEEFQNVDPSRLIDKFKNYKLKIIVYVRDQISYLLSSYAQNIQATKRTLSLEEYEEQIFKLDYIGFIEKWKIAFPDAELVINQFRKNSLYGHDIRKDFLVQSGISMKENLSQFNYVAKDKNPSIGGSLIEFKRLLNFTDFDQDINRSKFYKILGVLASKNIKYKLSKKMDKCLYFKLVDKYSQSNKEFSKLYLADTELELDILVEYANQFCLNIEDLDVIIEDIKYENKEYANLIKTKYYDELREKLSI